MLRKLAFLVILTIVLVAAYGAAANLGVDGGSIQAGVDSSLYCDPDGVEVTGWGLETDDSTVRYVKLSGIDEACFGNEIFVRVEDNSGNRLGFASDIVDASMMQFNFASPWVDAQSVVKLKVWIEGEN